MSQRIGVIGAGNWGRNLVDNFAELGVLSGVADEVAENRKRAREAAPEAELFESGEALLAAGYDAVGIATPAHTHFAIAKNAMEAGLDVFVEKPVTLDPAEAKALWEIAESTDRILMVGHLLLYQPAIAFVRSFLKEGNLGRIFSMHQRRSKLGRVRSVENVLWSFGVHDVAVLLSLAGTAPESVSVAGHAGISEGVEDDAYLHLVFPGGVQANLHSSWLWPRVERELIITGEAGILVFEELNSRVVLHRKTVDAELVHHDGGEEVVFEGSGRPLRLELEHFLECCRERKTPLSDGRNGFQVVEVLDRAEKLLRRQASQG